MNARVDEQPEWLPPIVLTLLGLALIQLGRVLRSVDENLADLGE